MEDFWLTKWRTNNTKWHLKDVNEFLEKHFDKYCPKVDGKLRAFVPLCGKMVDMKWLLDKGCEVVGVELARQACDEFFQEQLLEYDLLTVEGLRVYKAKDFPLTLYNCDFFDFAKKVNVGKFHFIWDRGSLTVMSKEDKPRYASYIKKWLADDFAYLIEAPLYSTDEFQGFPQALEFSTLTELYNDTCDFLRLEKVDFLEKAKKAHSPNLTSFFWCIYLLLPKKN